MDSSINTTRSTAATDLGKARAAFHKKYELKQENPNFWKGPVDRASLSPQQQKAYSQPDRLVSRNDILKLHESIEPQESSGGGSGAFVAGLLGLYVGLAAGSPALAAGGAAVLNKGPSSEPGSYSFTDTLAKVKGASAHEIKDNSAQQARLHSEKATSLEDQASSRNTSSLLTGLGAVGLATAALAAPALLPFGIGVGVALGVSSLLGAGSALLRHSAKNKEQQAASERVDAQNLGRVHTAVRDYSDMLIYEHPNIGSFLDAKGTK